MVKHQLSEFGREVKIALLFRNQTQEWLLSQLRERIGKDRYVDSSMLRRIMTGQIKKSYLEEHIRDILQIKAK